MGTGAITSYVDVAQLVLYVFWIFFFGVIYYLVKENRREGYPLETFRGTSAEGWIPMPQPKTYLLENGQTVTVPNDKVSPQVMHAQRLHGSDGTPLMPLGNPLLAGMGSGAWADRADHPDMDHHGQPKIRPLSRSPGCDVSANDPDPRGMMLTDAYGEDVGQVVDLWLDAPEMVFRYLEVQLLNGSRRVLVPMTFARITRHGVNVHALLAHQYVDVPATRLPDVITLLEEERISAYFGAGLLYAEPQRSEPLV